MLHNYVMLHFRCSKTLLKLPNTVLPLYITTGAVHNYGIFILTLQKLKYDIHPKLPLESY